MLKHVLRTVKTKKTAINFVNVQWSKMGGYWSKNREKRSLLLDFMEGQ